MRVRGLVAYDGTEYSGFQRQANALTVQEVLEAALARVTGSTREAVTVLAAGRTDAGVHATGQVVAFDTAWRHGLDNLWRALNAVLPADVSFLQLEECAADFHPRYDARSRRYRYTVCNTPVRWPLALRYSLHVVAPLDVAAMQQAARSLVGEHDFAAFGQPFKPDRTTVRRVLAAKWEEKPSFSCACDERTQGLPWLNFDIEANAFLYHMVRSVVGTLLQVGRGEMTVEEFAMVLASRDRSQAGPTAPPHGLCLVEVKY
ncbi:MAG: tRNA pseudouridine(38-40) synthase TruA [Anaerolineae bacterium]|nr:tRNA pseudouridine(38-40) synthase TruA [Anaerolineae bacterium]